VLVAAPRLAAPVVTRGWALLAALAVALVVVLTATSPRVPPVGDAVRVIDAVGHPTVGTTAELGVDLGVGCAVLATAAAVRWAVARRRPG
jgi:hypothetical protein